MSKIWVSPTGNTIRGHVLDCSVGPLVERLRDHDPQLYISWNPKKLRGWGCYEIRRRPNLKTVKEVLPYGGNTYVVVDYVENNFENHVLDVAFLNYKALEKIKQMDTWQHSRYGKNFMASMDSIAESHAEKAKEAALNERRYELKQHKTMVRDLMDYTLSGGDPSQIANHWK
jgi:hypothetical protein